MAAWCDQQYVQRVARAMHPRCRALARLLSSSEAPQPAAIASLCADPDCEAALRDLRAIGLGDCALASDLHASALSLQRDVVDVCLSAADAAAVAIDGARLGAGAAAGLALTLTSLFMVLVLVCAWIRRSRRKHPLQLSLPSRKRARRGAPCRGKDHAEPLAAVELSEEELRLQARGK